MKFQLINNIAGSLFTICLLRWFIVACKDGTFGHGCINNCSGECAADSPCNKQTGHCNNGCKPGYTNDFCNKSTLSFVKVYFNFVEIDEQRVSNFAGWCSIVFKAPFNIIFEGCVNSRYEEDCSNRCSKHCINGTCDIFHGSCVSGCMDGFIGDRCNQGVYFKNKFMLLKQLNQPKDWVQHMRIVFP